MGLIVARDKTYELTAKGKKFVLDIDITSKKRAEYSKRGVLLRAIRKTDAGYEWLFYQRLKQPYYGFVGFPAGKIFKGENPVDTAIREFKEETGLDMIAWRLIKIERNIILKSVKDGPYQEGANNIESDFYLYTFDIYEVAGDLRPDLTEGKYFWATLEQVKKMNTFPAFFDSPKETDWQTMPQRYNEYLKLKADGKWQNFPERLDKPIKPILISGSIYYEEWYLTDEGW